MEGTGEWRRRGNCLIIFCFNYNMTLHDNQTGALVVQDLDLDIADARAEYLEDLDQ